MMMNKAGVSSHPMLSFLIEQEFTLEFTNGEKSETRTGGNEVRNTLEYLKESRKSKQLRARFKKNRKKHFRLPSCRSC